MDTMNIKSNLMTGLLSKILKKILYKKLGYCVDVKLNNISINSIDNKIYAHLNVDVNMDKNDFCKLVGQYSD